MTNECLACACNWILFCVTYQEEAVQLLLYAHKITAKPNEFPDSSEYWCGSRESNCIITAGSELVHYF